MKRIISICLLLTVLLSASACRSRSRSNTYLPGRIEQIGTGGVVPEGYEAKAEMEAEPLNIASLYGKWVIKGANEGAELTTKQTVKFDFDGDGDEYDPMDISVFPESLCFRQAAYAGLNYTDFRFGSWSPSGKSEEDLEIPPIGTAFENLGMGYGAFALSFDRNAGNRFWLLEQQQIICYKVSKDMLSIGLSDLPFTGMGFGDTLLPDETLEETDIFELDYGFSLKGAEMTLTYRDESVTYVPETVDEEGLWKLEEAGCLADTEPLDGIMGISITEDPQKRGEGAMVYQMMCDIHTGYEDTDMEFSEDGTASINGKTYQYIYSGDSLTLIDQENTVVYNKYKQQAVSKNSEMTCSFALDGESVFYDGTRRFQWFLEKGFKSSVNTAQMISPFVVSDEILLDYKGVRVPVKVNNPYEISMPLKDCYVCYIKIDDKTGVVSKDTGLDALSEKIVIGETSYDSFDMVFKIPYQRSESRIQYKTRFCGGIINYIGDGGVGSSFLNKIYPKLDLYENKDVIFEFENGILQDVIIQAPALLFNGLQDNIDDSELNDMEPTQMVDVMKTRDVILARLKKAFADANVTVEIDPYTGEVDFDTSVLFQYNSDEFASGSAAYIDSFMRAYASVILDEELKDIISEIRFEGHTDSDGSYAHNLDLSQRRADAVLNYCLTSTATNMNRTQKEHLQEISTTIGRAYTDLVYNEMGEEDKVASRRVSVKFFIHADAAELEDSSDSTNGTVLYGELTAEDFYVYENGKKSDLLQEMRASDSAFFIYDDGTDDDYEIKTQKGITIGDSVNSVVAAYGQAEKRPIEPENFKSIKTEAGKLLSDFCDYYLPYFYGDEACIMFCFDEWNCVGGILYLLL